jgi:hypothetical protein
MTIIEDLTDDDFFDPDVHLKLPKKNSVKTLFQDFLRGKNKIGDSKKNR